MVRKVGRWALIGFGVLVALGVIGALLPPVDETPHPRSRWRGADARNDGGDSE